jgi:putative PIN family toxin of toxin-antitoxin system
MRVVVDTNVIVSALLHPDSLPGHVLSLALNGKVTLFVSEAILAEYEEVLQRPRFRLADSHVRLALVRIREAAIVVTPLMPVSAAYDPADNIFLECAEAAEADYLVTGNVKHFPAVWAGTQIISPRQLFEIFGSA